MRRAAGQRRRFGAIGERVGVTTVPETPLLQPPSGRAPDVHVLSPAKLILAALAIPIVSRAVSIAVMVSAVAWLDGGPTGDPLAQLAAGGSDAATEAVEQAGGLAFYATLLLLTLAVTKAGRSHLAWLPWPKDRTFLPFLAMMLVWLAIEGLLIEPRFPELAELARLPQSQPAMFLSLIIIVVVAPVTEELFFRGFLFTNVRAYWGFPLTIVMTSLYYAALHLGTSIIPPLLMFPYGLITGLVRERYGSVKPAIYLHVIWNLIAWGSGYFWPDAS
jgi:membrane protease YdiL (CAAX protease family)